MSKLGRQVERAIRWARWYRSLGWNPLATDGTIGHPPYPHVQLRDEGQSSRDFASRKLPGIQLATGARWGLVVVDLDGPTARSVWSDLARYRDRPRTWEVDTRSGGRHIYFAPPPGLKACPWRVVWSLPDTPAPDGRPRTVKHELIEILGDGRLAFAPPTERSHDGRPSRYAWSPGCSPADLDRPAVMPDWILDLKAVQDPVAAPRPEPLRVVACSRPIAATGSHDRQEVLAAISEAQRIELVQAWGLVLASARINPAGFISCHRAGDPDDRTPSASFHPASGTYSERDVLALSLFDLAAHLNAYPSWMDACNDLGGRFLPRTHELRRLA